MTRQEQLKDLAKHAFGQDKKWIDKEVTKLRRQANMLNHSMLLIRMGIEKGEEALEPYLKPHNDLLEEIQVLTLVRKKI